MDFKSLGKFEQAALISGGVTLVFSFISRFVSLSVEGVPGFSGDTVYGESAWGGIGFLAMLLIVVAIAVVVVRLLAPATLPDGVPWNLVGAAAAVLGTLLLVLRLFTASKFGVDLDPGWSGFVTVISAVVLSVASVALFKASGEKMPDLNKKDTPPAA
ncbi:hypothetical protein [Aeromicrobium sp.]|uniref:hypothetical protein n=1 Tax=Aeromicrobium sp. TaxID=1871063 RepID=UPI002FC6E225